jgi:hypothetical protein
MRGSLFGGKVDKDTLVRAVESREQKAAEEENIGEYKKASKTMAEEEKYSIYLRQQQTSCSAAQPQLASSGGAPF